MSNDVLQTLQDRGFVAQVTSLDDVRRILAGQPTTIYTGYDPTADSLHVGHLVTLMALLHLRRAGHHIITLMGDATSRVGDPSGKTQMRPLLSPETIDDNARRIAAQVRGLLGDAGTRTVRNGDWLLQVSYIDFLRDVGRHFSVNKMLSAEAYKARLARGLSFIEFNYQLLQAYDFLQLWRAHRCTLQLGGDDQWGNILAGIDLTRRIEAKQVHGLTVPLLTTATGDKMGKTAAGAVWLDADKTNPFAYYQYFVNAHDDDVCKLLKIFTLLPVSDIDRVHGLQGSDLNAAKSVLAFEACALLHGKDAAMQAHAAAQGAFGGRALAASLLPSSAVPRAATASQAAMPVVSVARRAGGIALVDLLVDAGFATSKNAARRLIVQGGVRLGDRACNDAAEIIEIAGLAEEMVLRAGKKRACVLRLA